MSLRVGVFGAAGRMGQAVCEAVEADRELELVAAVDPGSVGRRVGQGDVVAAQGPIALAEAGVDVAVDFTVAEAAQANLAWCAAHGVHAVVGTTGLSPEALSGIGESFANGPANCLYAPNFAIGGVLMMRFAEMAASWFDSVEIVELHHDAKKDSPSGTSIATARRIAAARPGRPGSAPSGGSPDATAAARGYEAAPGVQVHSVRMRGLLAHQEVLFGGAGETLTLRHDSLDRSSFMPGVVLAIKAVPQMRGFTMGLEAVLGL